VATQGPFFNVGNDDLLRRVNSRPLGSLEVEAERKELLSRGFSPKDFTSLGSTKTPYRPLVPQGAQATSENDRFPISGFAVIIGIFLALIGLYFLLVAPSNNGDVINLQRLTIGETFTIVGSILFVGGLLLRYQGANPPE
jgi:hypothetical protein